MNRQGIGSALLLLRNTGAILPRPPRLRDAHPRALGTWGLSEADYSRYLGAQGRFPESVDYVRRREAHDCWDYLYWGPGQCDRLPYAVAVVHLAAALHTGLPRAFTLARLALSQVERRSLCGSPCVCRRCGDPLTEDELGRIGSHMPRALVVAHCRVRGAWLDEIASRDEAARPHYSDWMSALTRLRTELIGPLTGTEASQPRALAPPCPRRQPLAEVPSEVLHG